jgi:hypothetical protein
MAIAILISAVVVIGIIAWISMQNADCCVGGGCGCETVTTTTTTVEERWNTPTEEVVTTVVEPVEVYDPFYATETNDVVITDTEPEEIGATVTTEVTEWTEGDGSFVVQTVTTTAFDDGTVETTTETQVTEPEW